MGNQSWNTYNELGSDINVEKTCFLNVKLKLLWINFNFSLFREHIFRSSSSQMFFKIGALKNFAILKITLQHRCLSVRSHVMLIRWYITFSKCWDGNFMNGDFFFGPMDIAKIKEQLFYITPPEAVVCRCSSE